MDPYCLRRDELVYELSVRGIKKVGAETLRTMRKLLKEKQEQENFGEIVTPVDFNPDIESEVDICNKKVVELEKYVDKFQGEADGEGAKFIFSLLQHLLGRLSRLQVDDAVEEADTWKECISRLLSQLQSLEDTTDQKCLSFRFPSSSQTQADLTGVQSSVAAVQPTTASTMVVHHKHIPVSQWGIVFDGKKTGLSVSAFLEKIETYQVARHASEEELKDSLVDLLKGDAAIWYSSIRSQVDSWGTFVKLFKEEYLPYDHNEKLWELIRARYQNSNEPVGTYFACMINLFNRLGNQPSEEEKLYILKRNILPYYIHQLGSQGHIVSVEELRKLCKKWEINRQVASQPRTSLGANLSSIEPDLAGGSELPSQSGRRNSVHSVSSNQRCWNCNEIGHRFQACTAQRRQKFCFRCGKAGFTRYSCPHCSKNAPVSRR